MSDPTSNVLFGADGTEVPDLSNRVGGYEAAGFPLLPLPAIPDLAMTREAIAAALDAELPPPADHNHAMQQEPHDAPTLQRPVTPPDAPAANAPAQPARAFVTAAGPPAQPASRAPRRMRLRPPVAAGPRAAVQFGDPRQRRRISLPTPRVRLPTRSDGGAAVFFIIAAIIFVVLAYIIVREIVESIIQLF